MGVSGQLLARAAAGQEIQEDWELVDPRDDLLDPHQGDVDPGGGGRETGVPFVLDDDDRPRLGDGEVHPRNSHLGPEILLAEVFSGDGGQAHGARR